MTQVAPRPAPRLPAASPPSPAPVRSLGLRSLCAAIFFMVSGGPYGLEEVLSGHGYAHTLVLLVLVPLLWSVPVALMVGELSAALPEEGGYYAWLRRALGPFWGFQQAWLALLTSVVDMAIYPTLFCSYLGRLFPPLGDLSPGRPGWLAGLGVLGACAAWNLRGARAVGGGATISGALLLLPFAVLGLCALRAGRGDVLLAQLRAPAPAATEGWLAGVLLCLWNYMGWDSASTIAAEVREPQRTYPRALLLSVAVIAGSYVLAVLAAAASGLPAAQFATGRWVDVGARLGGTPLAVAIALGGALCGLGMCSALMMSYSRLPLCLAQDGLLPRVLARRAPRSGAPAAAILVMTLLYAGCLGLGLRRLVALDVLLYGVTLLLQFIALVALRLREPALPRPFRVPGGLPGAILVGLPPLGLLGLVMWAGRSEAGSPLPVVLAAFAAGVVVYARRRPVCVRHPPCHARGPALPAEDS